jgi:RNA polymerase sigma-70 factor (ECF subfamily)
MSNSSMHDLAARLARGEEAAFAELYDACADQLHHYLAGRLGSRDAASDVLQTAFLRVVKSRRRFRGIENPVAYVFQVARNEAWRAMRQQKAQLIERHEALEVASYEAADQSDAEIATAAIARLDADEREIVELKIYGQLTFREIAEITQQPQGTVATRYRRALASLRSWLARQLR